MLIFCLAEDSSLIFSEKQWKKYLWMSSAAVVIGALRVKLILSLFKLYIQAKIKIKGI